MKKNSILIGTLTALLSVSSLTAAQESADMVSLCMHDQSGINITENQVFMLMRAILRDELGIEESIITYSSTFKYDLCMDSLDMLQFIHLCETVFRVEYDVESVMASLSYLTLGTYARLTFEAIN